MKVFQLELVMLQPRVWSPRQQGYYRVDSVWDALHWSLYVSITRIINALLATNCPPN